MFEIKNTRTTPIRIDAFDQAFESTDSFNMEIYTLRGPCDNRMLEFGAWSLVGNTNVAVSAASPNLVALPIPVDVILQGGDVQSFYITATNLLNSRFVLNSVGSNQYGKVYASGSDIDVVARGGVVYAFGGENSELFGVPPTTIDGHLWQGAVRYCVL